MKKCNQYALEELEVFLKNYKYEINSSQSATIPKYQRKWLLLAKKSQKRAREMSLKIQEKCK